MADKSDWRINEKYRKPRRTKGTPFYYQRNYYTFGALAIGGISWFLFELWPEARKLKRSLLEDKFDMSPGLRMKIDHLQASLKGGGVEALLLKARETEIQKIAPDKVEEQSWFSKLLNSKPDL